MDIFLCFDASQSVWAVPYGWWYLTWPKQDFMYPPTWLSKAQVKGRDSPMKFLTWEGKLSLFHDRSAFVRAGNVPKKGTQMLGRYSHLLSFATLFLLSSSFLHKFHPKVDLFISLLLDISLMPKGRWVMYRKEEEMVVCNCQQGRWWRRRGRITMRVGGRPRRWWRWRGRSRRRRSREGWPSRSAWLQRLELQ